MNRPSLLLALATVALAGCSSQMTKDECRTVDWRTVGYEDGVAGRPGDQIGAYRRACAEHGVTPNLDAYRLGRADGLREFCQPTNGYRTGASGATYYDVCPADLAPAFLAQYERGRERWHYESRVAQADAQIASRRAEIDRLEQAIAQNGFEVVSATSTPEQRTEAVIEAKQAAERIGRIREEIVVLQQERARYAQELEAYRARVAAAD